MSNVSVARRYAKALMDVVGAESEQVLSQLQALSKLIEHHVDFKELMTNPAYSVAQRSAVLEGLLRSTNGFHPSLANLLRLMVERNRMIYLADVTRSFRDLADAKAGRVRGKVTSAVVLSAEAVSKLEKSFEKLTQRHVVLETHVDTSVLGGVSAQVGSVLYDGTLRSQLQELRKSMA